MSVLARSSLKHLSQISRPQSTAAPPTTDELRTFTCFAKLPPEIRLKIFRFAAPEPRIIDVGVLYETREMIDPNPVYDPTRMYFSTSWHTAARRVPEILHVNQESRHLTLETYTLVLNRNTEDEEKSSSSKIYVNWERDIICPMGRIARNSHPTSPISGLFERESIHNIALNVRELLNPVKELRSDGCLNMQSLLELPNLEDIILYYSDPPPQPNNAVDGTRGFCMEFEFLNENFIVKDLCMMPLSERPAMSYLLAARKTVYKDYDVLIQQRKARDDLKKRGEEVPPELETREVDEIFERKRPTVKLAYLIVDGKYAESTNSTNQTMVS